MNFLISAVITFVACSAGLPIFLAIARILGLYAIVEERRCHVYVRCSPPSTSRAFTFSLPSSALLH
jgi:hypothetical protein